MKKKQAKVLQQIFNHPISGNIKWNDIVSLFLTLGADISEAEGSRVCVRLFGDCRVFHRPHPSPNTDKGAVKNIQRWLLSNGVKP